MGKRWLALLVGVLVIGVASGAASAQGFKGPRASGGGPAGSFPWLLRSVNLTDQQKTQIRAVITSHRDEFRTLRTQLAAAQQQLDDLLYSPTMAADQLTPLTQQINQLRGQLAQLRLETALEVRAVLTPDQLAKAAETRQQLNGLRSQIRSLVAPAR